MNIHKEENRSLWDPPHLLTAEQLPTHHITETIFDPTKQDSVLMPSFLNSSVSTWINRNGFQE